MRKLLKTKKAFTLLEIMLVVTILVILAGAVGLSVSQIINTANNASNSLAGDRNQATADFNASEAYFAGLGF